ncbi:MAG: hypothetical protein AB1813_13600 [Verrucomicrobiota bacterium]
MGPPTAATSRVSAQRDQVQFTQAEGLNAALKQTPAIRPGVVERARDLVGDVSYPPRETIRSIAELLALHLNTEDEED